MLRPMNFRAHFQEQRHRAGADKTEYVFELTWRRPEHAIPLFELMRRLDERFEVTSFELTTENGR
jgi:putative Mg2+ transporter-C (MgtC) family protein